MTNYDRWSNLPNNVLQDSPSSIGHRLPGGQIQCQSCTCTFDDPRNQEDRAARRQPSCPHCWVGLVVSGGDDDKDHQPKPTEPDGLRLQFPNFVLDGNFQFRRRHRRPDDLAFAQAVPDEADHRQVVLV